MIEICVVSGVITTTLMTKSFEKLKFCDASEQKAFNV